jgi:hypothetical protein
VIRAARHLLTLAALAALALPAVATASADQVIRDCARDGDLDRSYSNAELRKAQDELPADLDEYSDCREVIAGAVKGGSDRGAGKGSPGVGRTDPAGETAARQQDQADLDAIAASGGENPPSVEVGGQTVEPGANGLFDLASASNGLPAPLLIALIALALLTLGAGLMALRERVPALGRIPLLSKIPAPRVPLPWRR